MSRNRAILSTNRSEARLAAILRKSVHGWLADPLSDSHFTLIKLAGPPFKLMSQWQEILIVDTYDLGRCLVLDGRLQVAESDEFIYHEMLIHPAALLLNGPRRVLILGGGDGCAARELLRYQSVERIDLVDIDAKVVEVARDKLNKINNNSLESTRISVFIDDVTKFLTQEDEPIWDLIVGDLTDPFDYAGRTDELTAALFSPAFYNQVKTRLAPGGLFVVQTGGLSFKPELARLHGRLVHQIGQAFGFQSLVGAFVPSFEEYWTAVLASDQPLKPLELKVKAKLSQLGVRGLRFYNQTTHLNLFHPPLPLEKNL